MDDHSHWLTPVEPARRPGLAAIAVAVAVAAGVAATLALWHGKDLGTVPTAAPLATEVAQPAPTPQSLLRDGMALVPWPLRNAPIRVVAGDTLEIVLYRLPGENVEPLDPVTLAPVQPAGCVLGAVCGSDVRRWAFQARLPGRDFLLIDYGPRCHPSVCPNLARSLEVDIGAR